MSTAFDGLRMRSTLSTNPAMIRARISGCFPCRRGFFVGRGNRFDSQMGRCLTRFQPRAVTVSRFFVLGTKQRGELVRYDMKLHEFMPFITGISVTDPTFSRDGKWVAYLSYPEHSVWRSRSDGTERMQLTFPAMDARFPAISPDGTRVAFHTAHKNELFVIDMQGGQPQKVADNAVFAGWSPDGNYLLSKGALVPYGSQIIDLRTGKNSAVPSSDGTSGGFWLSQDTVMARNAKDRSS